MTERDICSPLDVVFSLGNTLAGSRTERLVSGTQHWSWAESYQFPPVMLDSFPCMTECLRDYVVDRASL